MDRLTEQKIILIVRRTRLDELIAKFNTESQARFYVEHLGTDFSDYLAEHRRYREAVRTAERHLARQGRLQVLDRVFVTNFVFGEDDTVVVLGQDGLVANSLKYLSGQPVIGVNPDPDRWDGVLLPFRVEDLPAIVPEVFGARCAIKEVTMAQAELSTGERLYGVNDLFIGPKSHISIRYRIKVGSDEEDQSSSGIIVSTGLGSTGWLKSIVAGAAGIAGRLSGKQMKTKDKNSVPWDAAYLYFSVREPFPSKTSAATVVFGKITARQPMQLVSHMPENGVIFSDGIESDFVSFNSGVQALISVADKRGRLVAR